MASSSSEPVQLLCRWYAVVGHRHRHRASAAPDIWLPPNTDLQFPSGSSCGSDSRAVRGRGRQPPRRGMHRRSTIDHRPQAARPVRIWAIPFYERPLLCGHRRPRKLHPHTKAGNAGEATVAQQTRHASSSSHSTAIRPHTVITGGAQAVGTTRISSRALLHSEWLETQTTGSQDRCNAHATSIM
ncbi:hypothetical protein BDV95DRAFT_597361 [Massariosphaeria phaeospora]|uniref:Uncharacterized protein n=1 Tax=Massariosphaeria phaeospora TaxID=100035 RepID=A0A7C8I9G7_9PLEO|nr:hypothetical protein BDV95DRAFT_597361 [Massariosphaeria phaeospora]